MALGRIPPDSISNTAYEIVFICSCGVKSYKKKKNQTKIDFKETTGNLQSILQTVEI